MDRETLLAGGTVREHVGAARCIAQGLRYASCISNELLAQGRGRGDPSHCGVCLSLPLSLPLSLYLSLPWPQQRCRIFSVFPEEHVVLHVRGQLGSVRRHENGTRGCGRVIRHFLLDPDEVPDFAPDV